MIKIDFFSSLLVKMSSYSQQYCIYCRKVNQMGIEWKSLGCRCQYGYHPSCLSTSYMPPRSTEIKCIPLSPSNDPRQFVYVSSSDLLHICGCGRRYTPISKLAFVEGGLKPLLGVVCLANGYCIHISALYELLEILNLNVKKFDINQESIRTRIFILSYFVLSMGDSPPLFPIYLHAVKCDCNVPGCAKIYPILDGGHNKCSIDELNLHIAMHRSF